MSSNLPHYYRSVEAYRIRYMKLGGGAIVIGSFAFMIGLLAQHAPMIAWTTFAAGGVLNLIGIALAYGRQGTLAALLMVWGLFAVSSLALWMEGMAPIPAEGVVPAAAAFSPMSLQQFYVVGVFAPFLFQPNINLGYGAVSTLMLAALAWMTSFNDMMAITRVSLVIFYMLLWISATRFSRYLRMSQDSLQSRLREIDAVVARAQKIAKGDLSGGAMAIADSDISRVIAEMLVGLRGIVQDVQDSVSVLAMTSTQISTMASEQQRGAVHQSTAVAQTRETIQSLAAAAHKITQAAEEVLRNARSAEETNAQANAQLHDLTSHTKRIDELLELVKDIANKSEILALNAALEGTRAGEAGRGFSLVAAQMRSLAENTASAIKGVKDLTSDINRSTSVTVVSMEASAKLARDTTVAARQISLITQQQSSGAEQVLEAMNDIATVTREFADGSADALAAIVELKALSERFTKVAHRFVL